MSSSGSTMSNKDFMIGGMQVSMEGSWLKTAQLRDEWHHDLNNPGSFVTELSNSGLGADVFTFWQRHPETVPRFTYYHELDPTAVLRVTTYEHWLKKQINAKTRNMLTKAERKGVRVRPATFDDNFVRGMVAIFNESPIRQGKPFWHYGKGFETVKEQFSRFLFREQLFGAYLDQELIGFIFLVDAGHIAMLGQIISMIRHRDKSPNNALIAKAVEVCAAHNVPFLAYASWPAPGSLRDFKKHNGFECVELPRYFVPLTLKGRIALKLKLHRGVSARIPDGVLSQLKDFRSQFYAWRFKNSTSVDTLGR
jgi:hypothetical protein